MISSLEVLVGKAYNVKENNMKQEETHIRMSGADWLFK